MDKEKLQTQVELITNDIQIVSEKLRRLISPLNAIKFYVDEIVEDSEFKEHKKQLVEIDKISKKCLKIIEEITEYTMPYFNK